MTGDDQLIWQDGGTSPGRLPTSSLDYLQQGGLGDCHFIATLGAVESTNPGWLISHVHANPNGSYTVTPYKNGQPVDVVVTPDVPCLNDQYGAAYRPVYVTSPSIFALYEKALAQTDSELGPGHRTGYDGMIGGWSNKDMAAILGHEGSFKVAADVSARDVERALHDHEAVTVSTPEYDDKPDVGANQSIVGVHQYYVQSVDTNAHSPTVTIVNPWGRANDPTRAANGTITLTWPQLQKYTDRVQMGGVR